MKTILILTLAATLLAGCSQTVVIGPDAEFFRPDRCAAWPSKADGHTDAEYILRGYQAYRCEKDTRLAAGEALKKLAD